MSYFQTILNAVEGPGEYILMPMPWVLQIKESYNGGCSFPISPISPIFCLIFLAVTPIIEL